MVPLEPLLSDGPIIDCEAVRLIDENHKVATLRPAGFFHAEKAQITARERTAILSNDVGIGAIQSLGLRDNPGGLERPP